MLQMVIWVVGERWRGGSEDQRRREGGQRHGEPPASKRGVFF